MRPLRDHARFADRHACGVVEVRRGVDALEAMSGAGFWAVVATFEGEVTAVRFADVRPGPPEPCVIDWAPLDRRWETSLTSAAYVQAVGEVRERIAAGTVYQVNVCRVVSHALDDDADLDGLDWLVRQGNPAPHGARIRCSAAGLDVVSASPELYLARRDGRLVTRPIKGTATTAAAMLPKDHAENVMIVDLMRNDLSRVCAAGSVRASELFTLERYATVHHLVSTVVGDLASGVDAFDLLRAAFPGGSITGAPKLRAMEIIAELEPSRRGVYCGSIGYWSTTGEMDTSIAIRTAVVRNRRIYFSAGGGIVADSEPEQEYQETLDKVRAVIDVLAAAQ